MAEESTKSVIIFIEEKVKSLPPTPSEPSIFKVDSLLRTGSPGERDTFYDPDILSVGPYHHGDPRLEKMEQIKYRYLNQLLKRRNEQSVERYVTALAAMEGRARAYYAEPISLDQNKFVRLMLLDGLFLIELFRYYTFQNLRDKDDPIFRHERILSQLRHDILLLENQLPFFVLNQLFIMTKTQENRDEELIALALSFVEGMFLNLTASQVRERSPAYIDNLCGLIHYALCLPFADIISQPCISMRINETGNWDNINSVSGLREAGIEFQKAKRNNNLMDIKFENGMLKIPQLSIFDETESQFRNLIAYEQYLPNGEPRCVSDYAFLMHCLINSSNDVELLRSRGIIRNCLGDDQEVCLMFNRLGRNILTSSNFCYSQVFCNLNKHCQRRVKIWKANLRRNYFNSPWSILSFFAAVALLLLTFTQTTYTVLAYYNRSR